MPRSPVAAEKPGFFRKAGPLFGPAEHLRRPHAGFLLGREAAGVDRFGDEGRRHAEVEGVLAHPLAGPLLLGGVEDAVDEMLAGCDAMDKRCSVGSLMDNPAYLRAAVHYMMDKEKGKDKMVMMAKMAKKEIMVKVTPKMY